MIKTSLFWQLSDGVSMSGIKSFNVVPLVKGEGDALLPGLQLVLLTPILPDVNQDVAAPLRTVTRLFLDNSKKTSSSTFLEGEEGG